MVAVIRILVYIRRVSLGTCHPRVDRIHFDRMARQGSGRMINRGVVVQTSIVRARGLPPLPLPGYWHSRARTFGVD